MRIAVILGAFSIGTRPMDYWFENPWISTRGMTGTEIATSMLASEMSNLGHEVHLFTVHAEPHNKPDLWQNVFIHNFEERFNLIDDSYDALISFNEPNVFIGLTDKPLRIVWQMLNDFSFVQDGFDCYVDQYVGVCQKHTDHVKKLTPDPKKWETIGLGCNPDWYEDKRVPGRVIWCSSADRGLHWLLQEWPKIKKEVPFASLRIFYHFNYDSLINIQPTDANSHPHVVEMAQRARYIREMVKRLKPLDVEHVGSVSRRQMDLEFSEACVFGFCCDTVAFSEGFSVSSLEAHASYTVPIIAAQDCLGEVYAESGAIIIDTPVKNNLDKFTGEVIKCLKDKDYSNKIIEKCLDFAKSNTWKIATKKMELLIKHHEKRKR